MGLQDEQEHNQIWRPYLIIQVGLGHSRFIRIFDYLTEPYLEYARFKPEIDRPEKWDLDACSDSLKVYLQS